MKFFSEDNSSYSGECENCGKVWQFEKRYCSKNDNNIVLNNKFQCKCGTYHTQMSDYQKSVIDSTNTSNNLNMTTCRVCSKPISVNANKCPHCGEILKKETSLVWVIALGIIIAVIVLSFG